LFEIFQDIKYKTSIGQLYDLYSDINSKKEYDFKSLEEEYFRIIIYKTSYYTIYLPLALGLILSGFKDEKIFKKTEEISLEIGIYFQVQDDYLDCFGDYEVMGKIGKDIEDRKLSWLLLQALKLSSDEQKKN